MLALRTIVELCAAIYPPAVRSGDAEGVRGDGPDVRAVDLAAPGAEVTAYLDHPRTGTQAMVVRVPGIRAMIAYRPARWVVVFRGTDSLRDWRVSARAWWDETEHGPYQEGAWDAWQEVRGWFHGELPTAAVLDAPIILAGHSLGGNLATAAAGNWLDSAPLALVTAGAPRSASREYAAHVVERTEGRAAWLANPLDPIVWSPFLWGRHAGRRVGVRPAWPRFGRAIRDQHAATHYAAHAPHTRV